MRVWQGLALIPDERWHTQKDKELLAILATGGGRFFSQTALSDALWPNANSEKSRANLRGRVSKLRRVLEPHLAEGSDSRYIRLEHGRYCLAKVPELEVDLEEFFQRSQQGIIAFERHDHKQAMSPLKEAIGLYKSGFLPEYSVHEWTLDWQQRCQEALRQSLAALAQCHERLGGNAQALDLWQQAFHLDLSHEETALQLMRCQMLLGMRQEALDTFERCRQALQSFEVAPSEELVSLHRHLRKAHFASPTAPAREPRMLLPLGLSEPPFVGRTQELRELMQCAEQAFSWGGWCVGILGEPGIGKTRLCREFMRHLKPEEVVTLHCEGSRFEPSRSYKCARGAILQCLKRLPDTFLEELERPIRQELEMALEMDQPLSSLDHANGQQAVSSQHLVTGLEAVIRAVASQMGRLVWWVEGLQWMDQQSFDLLCRLSLNGLPLLLVCSGDFGAARRFHTLLVEKFPTRSARIELLPLQEEHVNQLLQELSNHSLTPIQLQQLYRRSKGNPMYLSTLLVYLFNHNHFTMRGGRWEEASALPEGVLPLPIQEAVRCNLSLLEPDELLLLSAAAVLGNPFQPVWLRDMVELPEQRLMKTLDELISHRYLQEVDAQFGFSNDVVQSVLYEMLGTVERRRLHLKAAQALSRKRHTSDYVLRTVLAHHYEQAREYMSAYACVKQALELALAQFWVEPAQLLLQQAERLLHKSGLQGKPQRMEYFHLSLCRARYHGLRGERREQGATLDETLESLIEVGTTELVAQVQLEISWFCILTGRFKEALLHAYEALLYRHQHPDASTQGAGLQMAGRAYYALGRYRAALCCFAESHRIMHEAQDCPNAAQALDNLGIVQRSLAQLGAARASHERALAEFVDLEDEFGQGVCFNNLAIWWNMVGRAKEAWRWARKSYALHKELGNQRGQALALQVMAFALALRGKCRWSHGFLDAAQLLQEQTNEHHRIVHSYYFRGAVHLKQGNVADALSAFEQGARMAGFIEAQDFVCLLTSWQSVALLLMGRIEEALWKSGESMALLEQGFEPWPHLIHFHHARCLEAAGYAAGEVQPHLQAAHRHLMQAAHSITEPDVRQSYLQNDLLGEHDAIVAAYERWGDLGKEEGVEEANVS